MHHYRRSDGVTTAERSRCVCIPATLHTSPPPSNKFTCNHRAHAIFFSGTNINIFLPLLFSSPGQNYELAVKELKPAKAVGIVETDLNVDFDAPVGYDESLAASKAAVAASAAGAGSSGATGAIGGGAINIPAPASGGIDIRMGCNERFFLCGGLMTVCVAACALEVHCCMLRLCRYAPRRGSEPACNANTKSLCPSYVRLLCLSQPDCGVHVDVL